MEHSMTPQNRSEPELALPEDLLSEVRNQLPVRGGDFHVEQWKPSLMSRMLGFFGRSRD
ncbi:MAG TPA: hypothetical protein VMF03_09350 [Steroidobacteraceae bacterium]|nr:hypothetical protein [Steroidobacteraceae bacterium]